MEKSSRNWLGTSGKLFDNNGNQLFGVLFLIMILFVGVLLLSRNKSNNQQPAAVTKTADQNSGSLQMSTFTLEDVQPGVDATNVKDVLHQRMTETKYVDQILDVHASALNAWAAF